MSAKEIFSAPSAQTLVFLEGLREKYPSSDVALSKIAELKAELTLPKRTIHVISDIHGEFKKLKHVVNNASGSLRVIVDQVFASELSPADKLQLLNMIYYPRESYALLEPAFPTFQSKRAFLEQTVANELRILRRLSQSYALDHLDRLFPAEYRGLFRELLFGRELDRSSKYLGSILDEFLKHGRELDLLRLLARGVRNLLVSELVVGGDLGDRGERVDRVVEYLMRQPNVSITWGNHDVSWFGACLGDLTCIATVLRFSLRYGRLAQLEEGYGIPLSPLENLAREVYADDPAECFACKGKSWRDETLMARMQKAISIMLFKLEGQCIERNPQFQLEERRVLHKIDQKRGVVRLGARDYELRDKRLSTIDAANPYELTAAEASCMQALRESFLASPVLWRHITFVARRGFMYLRRDKNLIFHGCVPCDEKGNFLQLEVDGQKLAGRQLFDALAKVMYRVIGKRDQKDLDMLWYLWSGARSPLFGKDKMATFESHFVADKDTHHESKNPYFTLIHEEKFCDKILQEFGMPIDGGLIVNGHVPVKIEKGENPFKRSGKAITIDGAFSEAYGDHGYTLVLESSGTFLAEHHHFESVSDAIINGADIIPTIREIHKFEPSRTVADSEAGERIREKISALELLIHAYQNNLLSESVR